MNVVINIFPNRNFPPGFPNKLQRNMKANEILLNITDLLNTERNVFKKAISLMGTEP
jgi:hypothetical protein